MGYIYGIKNNLNEKWYVGQSIYYPTKRWYHEIRGDKNHGSMAISKAINKYGVDNFSFTILEEGVEEDKLDEREIFWIEQKDSYLNGYNSTRGGKSHIGFRIPYPMEEIAQYYIDNPKLSCREVANHFGIFHETVSAILKEFGIPIRRGKKLIIIKKEDKEWRFSTYKEAAEFLWEHSDKELTLRTLRKYVAEKDMYNEYEIIRL